MCGRIAAPASQMSRLESYTGGRWRGPPPAPRYNIGPGDVAPIFRIHSATRLLEAFQWGLIPSWAKDPGIGRNCFNARAETVHEKPAFRSAFKRRRCLVPVAGFYEWQKIPGQSPKQPWWIHPADGGPMSLAGLWEEWQPAPEAAPVHTFTIVTTEPNGFMRALHHRMPVILCDHEREEWLDENSSVNDLRALLRPCRDDYLDGHHVSTRVNIPTADGPELLEPAAPPTPL